jgi:hypothetical protein
MKILPVREGWGSFNYDQESGNYLCEWANMAKFDVL